MGDRRPPGKERSSEGQQNKQINQNRVCKVNGNVNYVVPCHRKAVDPVVERKGEIADISEYEEIVIFKPLRIRRGYKITEVLYNGVADKISTLIPLKRSIEGIGIDDYNEKDYAGNVDKGVLCQ
jgi:hypothetical protein